MIIGCVRELKNNEFRVGMTPDNVRSYLQHGHKVLVEKNAGLDSGFPAAAYEEAGATITETAEEVWKASDMIVKVKEPLPEEYRYFRPELIVYTYLHLAAERQLTETMMAAGVRGVAYETLQETDGSLPLLTPMSQIAGRLSIQEGAKYLEKPFGGSGMLLAGVPGTPKANVLIVGAGVVGAHACSIAVGMGANVTVIDINLQKLTHLDELFASRLQTLYSTPGTVEEAISKADLVIGAVLIPGMAAPKVITRAHLALMKPNSVIVDVAVDQGGCCETSRPTYHDNPTYMVDGIVHYCVGNMPGAVPRTSTIALTNATLKYGLQIADLGLVQACRENPVLYSAINTANGHCTCKNVCIGFDMEYKDPRVFLS